MDAKHVGSLFPLGAAATVTPAWMVLRGAVLSSSQRKLEDYERVSAVPPIQQVS